jgi:hypothetical protein
MVSSPIKLTGRLLSQSRVSAKGKHIRAVNRLVAQYVGKASQWVKKSSPQLEMAERKLSIIGTNIEVSAGSKSGKCGSINHDR